MCIKYPCISGETLEELIIICYDTDELVPYHTEITVNGNQNFMAIFKDIIGTHFHGIVDPNALRPEHLLCISVSTDSLIFSYVSSDYESGYCSDSRLDFTISLDDLRNRVEIMNDVFRLTVSLFDPSRPEDDPDTYDLVFNEDFTISVVAHDSDGTSNYRIIDEP